MAEVNMRAFMHAIYRISGKIYQIRNKEIPLEIGTCVNTAALSTLNVIDKKEQCNMSEISHYMGLTKGAVSQMATKLEQKGLIEKKKLPDNDKEVYLIVTKRGEQALDEYHHLHDWLYCGMHDLLKKYSEDEMETIQKFLHETGQFLYTYKEEAEREILEKSRRKKGNE